MQTLLAVALSLVAAEPPTLFAEKPPTLFANAPLPLLPFFLNDDATTCEGRPGHARKPSDAYAAAYTAAAKDRKPLIVLLSMEGCEPCHRLRDMLKSSDLDAVHFVELDQLDPIAGKIAAGNLYPQLHRFARVGAGWKKSHKIGLLPPAGLAEFLSPVRPRTVSRRTQETTPARSAR